MVKPGPGWFERNPKKTFFLLFLILFLALTFTTEKLLALKSIAHSSGIKRYVRLRDYEPSFAQHLVPSDEEMAISDSLVPKQYLFRIDDQGFLMPSKLYEHPDLSIVFLGGSTTACAYMEENSRFPYLAGRILEEKTDLKINSYNSGVGGNNSLHSLNILLNKIIPLDPQICVMMHNINDLTILLYEKTYWDRNPSRSPIVQVKPVIIDFQELVNCTIPNLYSELNNLAKKVRRLKKAALRGGKDPDPKEDEFRHIRGQRLTFEKGALVKEFKKNLQTFINLCRAREIIPVLMTQPNRLKDQPDPKIAASIERIEKLGLAYRDYKDLFDLFNQAIREISAQNEVRVIDLAQKVPQDKEYIYDIVHLNDNGSKLAARLISEDLRPVIASLKASKRAGKVAPLHLFKGQGLRNSKDLAFRQNGS